MGRIVAIIVALTAWSAGPASADSVLMWEFSGQITRVGSPVQINPYGLADLYPVGTPVIFDVTFDSAAPKVSQTPASRGVYTPILGATLRLGDSVFTKGPSGFLLVNCNFGLDCLGTLPEFVEFLFPSPFWSPSRLNPANPHTNLVDVDVLYRDPSTHGQIPLLPPSGPAGMFIGVSGGPCCEASMSAQLDSVRDMGASTAVPEPATVVLFTTGLAMGLRRRKPTHTSIPHASFDTM